MELFAGCFGWSAGWLADGGIAIGFDLEHFPHHGPVPDGAMLVLQDVLTLHGSQFKDADLILASPPCVKYSWLAMPWSRSKDPNNSKAAKALRAKWEAEGPDNRLFDACFRIQREAIEATRKPCYPCGGTGRSADGEWPFGRCVECQGVGYGPARFIPLIVENVRGAQEWVGRAPWNYGSFYLWGDVPALMPIGKHRKNGQTILGTRVDGEKTVAHVNKRDGHDHTRHLTNQAEHDAVKVGGDWFRDPACHSSHGSKSSARKAASAMIAKIPLPLSTHIARVYKP